MAFEQLSQSEAHSNPYYTIYKEDYTLPNGETSTYYAIRNLRTVFVVPFISASEILLVKQFRYLYQEESWEFPAGRVDDGEDALVAAKRELQEESGYTAASMHHVGWFAPSNGLTDEHTDVYLATDLTQTNQQLDDTEAMTVHTVPIDEFERMIDNNTARDGMSIAAWRLIQAKRKELFS